MGNRGEKPASDLHLRFNHENRRHREAAAFIGMVKPKQKTALITAAIESYRAAHPHGVDYKELETIQKESWTGFLPKTPILENLKKRPKPAVQDVRPSVPPSPPPACQSENGSVNKAMDDTLAFYDLDSDEDD